MKRTSILLLLALLALALPAAAQDTATAAQPAYEIFVPEVIAEFPHGTTDFTQGLVWSPDGRLFQSVGRYGESRLQELDPETGEVLREVALGDEYFAEGLAQVGDRLIQLTWREQTALVWDIETFEQVDEFSYETEGWGLCYDEESLWLSDGSASLFRHDPETFEALDSIEVTLDGEPVPQLNELECVGDDIWANVWQTPFILRIDKATGEVTGIVDGRGLLTEEILTAWASGAVLNGIAWIPERETFLITGKNWPVTYEVTLTPVDIGP